MQSPTSDWRHWGVTQWNERLLAHFFTRRGNGDAPVTTLLATQEEIARATRDVGASPDAARDAFIAATLSGVRHRSLLDTAADYRGYPAPPLDDEIPRFISCLVFTCIAAAESSEDLAGEGSFVSRLRRLTNDQLPDPSLQILPRLWENLASWLAREGNPLRYRLLRLPDPGGLTRIGYTTKLAFPDRRDQKELSDLLDTEGLLGHEPPVGKVLSLVARERARFRPAFLEAFEEFRHQFTVAAQSISSRLLEHRFWAAVREAALLGRGRDDATELRCKAQLLAELRDDQLVLHVVSDASVPVGAVFATTELPFSYGAWRYRLVMRSDAGALGAGAFEQSVGALLSMGERIYPLSGYIEQGLLPFVETNHGLLELAPMDAIGDASIALVRKGLERDLVELYGNANTRIEASRYSGWLQVDRPNLASLPSDRLESTSLRRVWMLHRSVSRLAVVLADGIRTDDGWLGLREVLPRVRAPGVSAVVARSVNEEIMLRAGEDGSWSLPARDFNGSYDVEIRATDGEFATRAVRFSMLPTSEDYKEPADQTAWITEGVGSTSSIARPCPFIDAPLVGDAARFSERIRYLGQSLGEFVDDPLSAAWAVTEFGGKRIGRRVRSDLALPPFTQSASARARRLWRTLLLQCDTDATDPGFGDARHAVRQRVQRASLPEIQLATVEAVEPLAVVEPHQNLEKLVGALAARANSKCGLSWHEWSALVQVLLGIDEFHVSAVTRAWQEIGALDVLSASRWRHRCVFAKRPRLVAYRAGHLVGATLVGLSLATTRSGLVRAARGLAAAVDERHSVSPFVPPSISVRTRDMGQLETIARAIGTSISTVDLGLDRFAALCTHDVIASPPVAYHWSKRWPTWSLANDDTPAGPVVVHWMRDDRPSYWLVSHDETNLWSYDLNVARWWAARLADRDAMRVVSATQLEAHHAYLPLPIARVASLFVPAIQGPEPAHAWRYRYSLGTMQLRNEVQVALAAVFNLHRFHGA